VCIKVIRVSIVILFVSFFAACSDIDDILPSASAYKINAQVNGVILDECSFIGNTDQIQPFFENSIIDDPDVTGLMVYFKNTLGIVPGSKVIYSLEKANIDKDKEENLSEFVNYQFANDQNESEPEEDEIPPLGFQESDFEESDDTEDQFDDITALDDITVDNTQVQEIIELVKDGDDTIIYINSLDENIPFYPIPGKLPAGRYTIVFQVLNGSKTLHKSEKNFYYLADMAFSFKNIQIHLPGIATDDSQLIPTNTFVMLDAKIDLDSRLDPYIIWYNGKKIIDEGTYSQGKSYLLWKTPEQSGFLSLRVEVYPVQNRQGLAGYFQEISLPVSSKTPELHLLSQDDPNLLNWYLFAGNVRNSINPTRYLQAPGRKKEHWMAANGSYGLATGNIDNWQINNLKFPRDGTESTKILFRFKPLSDGDIFSIQFGAANDAIMTLAFAEENFVLTLASSQSTLISTYQLTEQKNYLTLSFDITIFEDTLAILPGFTEDDEPLIMSIALNGEAKITLGSLPQVISGEIVDINKPAQKAVFTALWDEFALLRGEPIILETEEETASFEKPVIEDQN
jgi:hypothetical protein